MKIYTKGGDKGKTSLVGGERVCKDDPRVDAYGTVDELSAVLAYLRDSMEGSETALDEYREDIMVILGRLMTVEALLAACGSDCVKIRDVSGSDIAWLERRIDTIGLSLEPIERFTLPGGHPFVSWSHVCRTVCRRAERAAVHVSHDYPVSENAIIYLNRLSDYLYQLGRKLSDELGVKEVYWNPEK